LNICIEPVILNVKEIEMELDYTYWQEKDGWYLGYLNTYPDRWTQGKTIRELEEMLRDLYELAQEEEPQSTPDRHIGKLAVALA
jgi:predicted RNase H-like HicB family nuclease